MGLPLGLDHLVAAESYRALVVMPSISRRELHILSGRLRGP